MSIQKTSFPLLFDPDDLQHTHRGVTWGIKCWQPDFAGGSQVVYACVKKPGGWDSVETLDDGFDIHLNRDHGGDAMRWLTERLLPKLNAWLAVTFPAGAGEPAPDLKPFEMAHKMIGGLRIRPGTDGTLKAEV
jgi:hypothetical protein